MTRLAPDIIGDIRRMQEEIRQLRLRPVQGSDVQPWLPLYPYLKPWWQALVNDDPTDLTDPAASRFYLDRDRVYFGGVVKFDAGVTLPGGEFGYTIIQDTTFPAECIPGRQQDFIVWEDRFWSDVASQGTIGLTTPGWGPAPFVVATGTTTMYAYVNDHSGGSPPDGLAICLDDISYRVSA